MPKVDLHPKLDCLVRKDVNFAGPIGAAFLSRHIKNGELEKLALQAGKTWLLTKATVPVKETSSPPLLTAVVDGNPSFR